jgi:hypothetical protein
MCHDVGSRHPLVTDDEQGKGCAGECFICCLYKQNSRLVLGIKAAADLLQEGKQVQCHQALIDLLCHKEGG